MDPQPNQNETSSDEHVQLNSKSLTKLIAIIVVTAILALLVLAIVLPVLNQSRGGGHRLMKNTTQIRGICQGMVTYANGNKEHMPGVDSKGYIHYDNGDPFTSDTGASGHGATIEARYWIMLDNNNFSGDYIISPAETKTPWMTGPVTSANYSYAMLNLHDDANSPNRMEEKIRPNQAGRAREWKQSINTQAVLLADRARIPGGRIGNNFDKIYSIHTSEDDEEWAGSIGRGDGSALFEQGSVTDTKYGAGSAIEADRLFAKDQDSNPEIDKLTDPSAPWDDTANALLGYTSVGYQDPDIASE